MPNSIPPPYSPAPESRLHKRQHAFYDIITLLAGIALAFAFAPHGFSVLAFIIPGIYAFTLNDTLCDRPGGPEYRAIQATAERKHPSKFSCFMRSILLGKHTPASNYAAIRGFLFGLGFFSMSISWVYISIHTYGKAPMFISAALTALLILWMSAYFALQAWLTVRLTPKNDPHYLLLTLPATWVLTEYLRAHLFTGFPWVLLGYSQASTVIGNWLPIIGSYGVSFICVFIATLVFLTFRAIYTEHRVAGGSLLYTFSLILIFALTLPLQLLHWDTTSPKALHVSLVQGNIPLQQKWSAEKVLANIATYQKLSALYLGRDLLVWPEAAVPVSQVTAKSILDNISNIAKQNNTTIITGIPIVNPDTDKYYNGLLALGSSQGKYLKRRLVPFGEYFPLKPLSSWVLQTLKIPMSDFVAGPIDQPLIDVKGTKIASYICYEIAYSNIVRHDVSDAGLLLTISDDAWFGDSWAPAQHLQIAQARSRETSKPQLVATNNGITAVINRYGRIVNKVSQFKRDVLTATVHPVTGTTPWIRWGDLPIILLSFLLLGFAWLKRWHNLREQ